MELSADIYTVAPEKFVDEVTVLATWLGGSKIDLDAFIGEITAIDPTEHQDLTHQVTNGKCC